MFVVVPGLLCLVFVYMWLGLVGAWGRNYSRDTHTPSTGEGKRRAGAPSLALEGLCNWFSGF